MQRILFRLTTSSLLLVMSMPVYAQGFPGNQYGRTSDPNLGHFYMGRQEIQVLDNVPVVNDMRSNPKASQKGSLPTQPQSLPRAGFIPYSSSIPSLSNSLPKVVNGVPPKLPPPTVSAFAAKARLARAGKYKAKNANTKFAPTTAKVYAPYKGYGGPTTSRNSMSAQYPANSGSATAVSGSLLHWSRTGH